MVTLTWIKSQGQELKTFVENCTQEIRNNLNTINWLYFETSSQQLSRFRNGSDHLMIFKAIIYEERDFFIKN